MLTGIVRKDGSRWMIDYRYPLHDRPVSVGTSWEVLDMRRTGPLAPDLAPGLQFTHIGTDRWQAYKEGDYLVLASAKMGERLPELPVPQPKVRAGIDTRYYRGDFATMEDADLHKRARELAAEVANLAGGK